MDQKQKENAYVMAFIKSKGGAKKMQHAVDLGYQALLQLEQGKRFGSPESFRKLVEAYPDFDIAQALGQPASHPALFTDGSSPKRSGTPSDDGTDWKAQYYALETRFSALERKYDELMQQYNRIVNTVMQKLNPSFNWSTSQITTEPMYGFDFAVAGFVVNEGAQPAQPEAKVIRLYAADNVRPLRAEVRQTA